MRNEEQVLVCQCDTGMNHENSKIITGDRSFGKTCGRRCDCLGLGQFCQNFGQIATRIKYVVYIGQVKKIFFQNTQKSLPIPLEDRIKHQKLTENDQFGDISILALFQMVQRALGPLIIYFCYQIQWFPTQNFTADLILARIFLEKDPQTPKLTFWGCLEGIRASNCLFLTQNQPISDIFSACESKSGKKN